MAKKMKRVTLSCRISTAGEAALKEAAARARTKPGSMAAEILERAVLGSGEGISKDHLYELLWRQRFTVAALERVLHKNPEVVAELRLEAQKDAALLLGLEPPKEVPAAPTLLERVTGRGE